MSKPIDGAILKRLRTAKGMTQEKLAKDANINKDTVSRLERGQQSGAAQAGKKLAKALGVEPTVLTGETKILTNAGEADSPWRNQYTCPLNVRVDSSIRNAYDLASIRYKISIEQIVKIAPLLFIILAERSLETRRKHLSDLEAKLDEADGIAEYFQHLPGTFLPSHALSEAIGAEAESIEAQDIFAERLEKDGIWSFQIHKPGYDADNDNPFVESLRNEATALKDVDVTTFSSSSVDFTICRDEAMTIACNDTELAGYILSGGIRLSEMPPAFRKRDAREQRIVWMREKVVELQASFGDLDDLFADFDLATLAEPAGSEGAAQ